MDSDIAEQRCSQQEGPMKQHLTITRSIIVTITLLITMLVTNAYAQNGTEGEGEGCKQCQWLVGTCTHCPSGYSTGWWSCFGTCSGWCSVSNACNYALEATAVNAEGALASSSNSPQAVMFLASTLMPSLLAEEYERNCKGIVIGRYFTKERGRSLRASSQIVRL